MSTFVGNCIICCSSPIYKLLQQRWNPAKIYVLSKKVNPPSILGITLLIDCIAPWIVDMYERNFFARQSSLKRREGGHTFHHFNRDQTPLSEIVDCLAIVNYRWARPVITRIFSFMHSLPPPPICSSFLLPCSEVAVFWNLFFGIFLPPKENLIGQHLLSEYFAFQSYLPCI